VNARRINHVSIPCRDLDESERFYRVAFGLERVPAPDFRRPVRWLRLGEHQVHLMETPEDEPLPGQHFGFDVDDFEAVYLKLRELGAIDDETHTHPIWELPDGSVQMYARDPAGNLIEIDWPDVTTLDRSVVTDVRKLDDDVRQTGESAAATLYTPGAVR
jgi:catechol 2,3-dioxygenase-like lactoylglutathione lyase family enzyme